SLPDSLAHEVISGVAAGAHHSLLLTAKGDVYALGENVFHTVSKSDAQTVSEPTKVWFEGLRQDEKITQLDSSRDHNIALTSQGRVYTWGSNFNGQLGDGGHGTLNSPKLVKGAPKATQIAAGYRHSAIITDKGEVYGWGGVCTKEDTTSALQLIEQAASGISALGGYGSTEHAALTSHDIEDCTTVASTFVQSTTPQKLDGLTGMAKQISIGYGHILVMTESGEIYSAGCNTYRQLGRDKAADATKNELRKVQLPATASQMSAGYRHSAVILQNGSSYAWGYNGPVQSLGVDSAESTVSQPTKVQSDSRFEQIEAGQDATFATTNADAIIGWGQDDVEAFWEPEEQADKHIIVRTGPRVGFLSAGFEHLLILRKE
ncbi:MAG TPA: hypothetical protein VF597_02230, partial [Candidatus Saccharimonadales bacterium]